MRRVVINSSCNNIIEKYPTRPKPIDLVVSLTTYKFRIEHDTLMPVLQHMFN